MLPGAYISRLQVKGDRLKKMIKNIEEKDIKSMRMYLCMKHEVFLKLSHCCNDRKRAIYQQVKPGKPVTSYNIHLAKSKNTGTICSKVRIMDVEIVSN